MTIKSVVALLALTLGIANVAHADDQQPFAKPAVCGMSFEAKGGGLQILIGHFAVKGQGVIKCKDLDGNETRMPVEIQIGGHSPIALKLAAGYLRVAGIATGIGYAHAPQDLLGNYDVINAEAAVGLGAGAKVGLKAKHGAKLLDVALQVERGVGFNVGFTRITIRPL